MEMSKNPFSLSLQTSNADENEGSISSQGVEEDPDLKKMIEQEPDYQEDQEQMKIIEERAKAWTKSQRNNTPRGGATG
jgi:hypothetical protein